MVSFTEEQLRDNFDKLQTGVSDFRSKLNSTKLDLPNTTANDQSFRGFESRITYLAADTIKLQAAVQERQKRKQDMAGEVYDSHVVADLVKSRALMGHLDTLLKDLGHFKKKAAHNEQIGKMGMSSLDLLKAQSVLVRLSKQCPKQF
jgi:hypothetical protein